MTELQPKACQLRDSALDTYSMEDFKMMSLVSEDYKQLIFLSFTFISNLTLGSMHLP